MQVFGPKLRLFSGPGILAYWCPGCDCPHELNTNPKVNPDDPRWTFDGNRDAPTFHPAVLTKTPVGQLIYSRQNGVGNAVPAVEVCHCWVKAGMIEFLPSSTHHLSGQTVPLPDFDET